MDCKCMYSARICQNCLKGGDMEYDEIYNEPIQAECMVQLFDGRYTHIDNTVELYNGEHALPSEVIGIGWGQYEGELAHRDDERLIYRYDINYDMNCDEVYGWGIE